MTLSQTFCSVMHAAAAAAAGIKVGRIVSRDTIASSRDAATMRALRFIDEVMLMLMNILLARGAVSGVMFHVVVVVGGRMVPSILPPGERVTDRRKGSTFRDRCPSVATH